MVVSELLSNAYKSKPKKISTPTTIEYKTKTNQINYIEAHLLIFSLKNNNINCILNFK
jgi:hypothetical protein